jgi:hypothetical protein
VTTHLAFCHWCAFAIGASTKRLDLPLRRSPVAAILLLILAGRVLAGS